MQRLITALTALLLAAPLALPVSAETISQNNGDGTFTFGWRATVPAQAAQNDGLPTDKDISGVRDAIGIALGLLLPCNQAAIDSGLCPAGDLGKTYKRLVACTQEMVDAGSCTAEQLGQQVPDPLTVGDAFDAWIGGAIRSTVRNGRRAYQQAMAADVPETTELE